MKLNIKLVTRKDASGHALYFAKHENQETGIIAVPTPVIIETWNMGNEVREHTKKYDILVATENGFIGESLVNGGEHGIYVVKDEWLQLDERTWGINRKVTVKKGMDGGGFRLRTDFLTDSPDGRRFPDLRYFAPPALYDKNDLDEDGVEDWLETQNLMYREDRLNMLGILAYDEQSKLGVVLARADRPEFDDCPERPNKERIFLQKTDIGSLGIWNPVLEVPQVCLRACYPFFEGERSHALYMKERPGVQAFWPAQSGETVEVSYQIRFLQAERFIDALWESYTGRMKDLDPKPVPLPATAEELIKYRLESLNRYYVEEGKQKDPNEPAGYVLNCHPQDGVQLSNIIQFGFTGQNVLSAYNTLRYGYFSGNGEYVRRGRKIVDFFVNKVHIPETGMFYNYYNLDKGEFDFWWTGLLLPLAYAEGEKLEQLMGPLYKHRELVIKRLKEIKGSYLRCMNEDAEALLRVYEFERGLGFVHDDWLKTAVRYGEFLLRTQEEDGSWYRAYDIKEGKPITDPPFWFGTTIYEQKSSTATSLPFLTQLYAVTGDQRFLDAAVRAGRFVKEIIVERVRFNGGIHDSIYAKGQLIDNESIYFPMIGLLALYRITKDHDFLQGAYDAAKMNASWTVLWDVPLPPGSTLAKFGFRSTGIGACDTPGAGYVHPYELAGVAEMAEIAQLTGDLDLLFVAELLWHGCNQTVAVPGKDWGYKYIGLQEEGYLISWWAVDDPMFTDTGFGGRLKGEGNKTCFPWIPAVAVSCYWKLIDKFGTTDFNAIKKKMIGISTAKVNLDDCAN